MIEEKVSDWKPICVASTEDSDADDRKPGFDTITSAKAQDHSSGNYFKGAEWSPDGTTLLTDSADHHIRTFILPLDLLDEKPSPHRLSPYSTLPSAEPTYDTAIYPFYSLQDPSTTLFLSSVRDHPIKLTSALAPASLATYSLVNPTTEAFITPHSIIYPSTLGGTHFLTGSDSLICLFDISRPGSDGPVSWMPTIPSKRKQMVGGGVGMKGIISAMAVNPVGDGILAAGTFTRQIGLYGSNGSGESLGTFSIAKTEATRHIGGRGVTQVQWSPCGRYLYVAERKSDGVLIYDIRVAGQLLGWLQGRKALTNQRMKVDVVPSGEGDSHELWAGGTDGFMRVWRNPAHTIGGQDPDWEWKVHDGMYSDCLISLERWLTNIEDSVASTIFHPMGTVAATCSGQRHYLDGVDDDDESRPASMKADNTLKIWSLPFLETPSDG